MRSITSRHLLFLSLFSALTLAIASTRVAAGDPPQDAGTPVAQPSASASAAAAPYRIDARKSQFFVEADTVGVLAVFAHNHKIQVRDFSGTVTMPSNTLQSATLDLSIVLDSLTLVDKVSDDDRKEIEGSMKTKVLETAKFPKVSFRTVSVTVDSSSGGTSHLTIVGNLWLHGVGHKIPIAVTVARSGDSTLRATGTMKLRQTDYGMSPYTAVAGTIRTKDEVTLSFDIVATR